MFQTPPAGARQGHSEGECLSGQFCCTRELEGRALKFGGGGSRADFFCRWENGQCFGEWEGCPWGVRAVIVSLRRPKAREPRHGVEDRGKKVVSVLHQHGQATRHSARMQNWPGTQGEPHGGLRLLAGTQTHQPTGEKLRCSRGNCKNLYSAQVNDA